MTNIDPDNLIILGIDPSPSKGFAIANLNGPTLANTHYIHAPKNKPREPKISSWNSLMCVREAFAIFLNDETWFPRKPDAIWVEQAAVVSKSNAITSAYAVAIIKMVVQDVWNMPTFEVPVTSWKKFLTGYGNSDKNEVIDILQLSVPNLDRFTEGLTLVQKTDICDAIGIAKYGRDVVLRGLE